MITCMCDGKKFVAVTNRRLCGGDYLGQIEKIACFKPSALILREKDLSDGEYLALAIKVGQICETHGVDLYIHTRAAVANKIGCENLHLSLAELCKGADRFRGFRNLSVSCHSVEDVLTAQKLGATRAVVGNIFETDCKKGLPGKGLEFLRSVCFAADIPIYAIGGINENNIDSVIAAGASGGCMMSGFMQMK